MGKKMAARHPGMLVIVLFVATVLLVTSRWQKRCICGDQQGPAVISSEHDTSLLSIPGVQEHHRLRLSRITLDKAHLWMATPDWQDNRHPHYGSEWYEQAWTTSRFNYDEVVCGQRCVEKILEAVPCTRQSLVLQAGAHLGVFPFIGMALGCSGLSIEGNPIHIPFMTLNARLNGFHNHFKVINAIVGEKDSARGLSFAGQSIVQDGTPGAVTVPMVALDSVLKDYSADISINLAIVDTEGYENNVLKGASQLVRNRRVDVWVIEVWYRQSGKNVSDLPGLQNLVDSGYLLYDVNLQPVDVDRAGINKMLSSYCAKPGWRSGPDGCLMDHLAVKKELADKVVASLRV